MKRTSLTTAVIAGIVGVAGISSLANAVYLNGDGLGQALIYPYYTVNPSNGSANSTALTIVNTTNQGKAIKVRFLEGWNSREVLDFNLYMSPYDVWTAQVVPNGTGAGVFSRDNSCTVPALPNSAPGFAFSSFGYDGTTSPKDGGPTALSRTTEGYVEMIEMGTVTNASQGTLTAITHINGVPKNCAQLITAFTPNSSNPYWVPNNGGNLSTDITDASGGLFGSGSIVNVVAGTVEGYNAEAIDRYWDVAPLATFRHTDPSSLAPSIVGGSSLTSYVFAQSSATVSGAALITTDYTSARDAVSSLFMADTIYNEYWTGGGTALSSEWVVTFPTKRFYVDAQLYATSGVIPPFDVLFDKTPGNNGIPGSSCSPVGVGFYDREERTPGVQLGSICPSPLTCGPQVTTTTLCYEANVVTFNQANSSPSPGTSSVLGSSLVTPITTGYDNGWANIDLVDFKEVGTTHSLSSDVSSNTFLGLPATGFWVTQFLNSNVSNGVLANYTSLYKHKIHRAVQVAS